MTVEAHRLRWMSAQKQEAKQEAHQYLSMYLGTVRKMSALPLYDSLYSLWHALHLPALMMLVAAAALHVLGA